MATTMGGVSSAMVRLSMADAGSSGGRLISRKTVDMVSAVSTSFLALAASYPNSSWLCVFGELAS
jgi:hypothetical protein